MGCKGMALNSQKKKKRVITPKKASIIFPTSEQMQFVRQLCKAGMLQKYNFYGRYEKKILRGCFKRMDDFLKATDRNLEKSFASLLEEMS